MKAKVIKGIVKNKVKDFREAKAWGITELAKEAGITYQTISKMEKEIGRASCRERV